MPTSGNVDFTMTAREIINQSFSKMGKKTAEIPLEDNELSDGLTSLNMMVKAWAAQGLHLWSKDEGVLFLDAGKADYNLGPEGDEACQLDDFMGTTTTSSNVSTDVIIELVDTSGMLTGDQFGQELDDNTRHWTTILTVDSATQVTITDGLPSASKSGNSAFTFTNLVQRPNRILSYRRKVFNQDNEIPVISWSRDQYFNQVNKTSSGTVVNCYYSPQLGNGRVYVWQTASSVNDLLRFTFERPLENIDDPEDTLDFPPEWLEAIVYGLAWRLSDDYSVPFALADRIGQKANNFKDEIIDWDEEKTSLFFQPDFS